MLMAGPLLFCMALLTGLLSQHIWLLTEIGLACFLFSMFSDGLRARAASVGTAALVCGVGHRTALGTVTHDLIPCPIHIVRRGMVHAAEPFHQPFGLTVAQQMLSGSLSANWRNTWN